jgi:hypothetical protein
MINAQKAKSEIRSRLLAVVIRVTIAMPLVGAVIHAVWHTASMVLGTPCP